MSIADTKRWLDWLPQKRLVELRGNSTRFRMHANGLDPSKDLSDKSLPPIGTTLVGMPKPDLLRIYNRRLCKADAELTQLALL